LFLSDDASIDRDNDFMLGFFTMTGDLTSSVNGNSQVRLVRVADTAPPLADSFGRDYVPQPDDGFLDIGETVVVSYEVLIPKNYAGTYFVGAYSDSLGEITEIEEDVNASFGDQGDNIFVQDLTPQIRIVSSSDTTTEPVSEQTSLDGNQIQSSNGLSDMPAASANGKWIAFQSSSTNLDPESPGNGRLQIYLRNRETREIRLISRNNTGVLGDRDSRNPAISGDGRFIVYESLAANLVQGVQGASSQIFVYDRALQRTTRVSINASGQPANGSCFEPDISEDGRLVVFESIATNLDPLFTRAQLGNSPRVQTYVHNRDLSGSGVFDGVANTSSTLLSATVGGFPANQDTLTPAISMDGRTVVFASRSTNFTGNPLGLSQVWRRDLQPNGQPAGVIELVSVDSSGVTGNGDSVEPAINGGTTTPTYGLQIAFASEADNLVANDTNEVSDIFVRDYSDPVNPKTVRASVSNPRVASGRISFFGGIDDDNTPLNQPVFGDSIELNDGFSADTFVFGVNVPIGPTTGETRDNLAAAINGSPLNIVAYPSDAPTGAPAAPPLGSGLLFNLGRDGLQPSILLFNTVPGVQGNQPIVVEAATPVTPPIVTSAMAGGGTQAEDILGADLTNPFNIAEGSLQPSMDRTGRIIAFRSLAGNLSVVKEGERFVKNGVQPDRNTPRVGEVIRPLLRFGSNVYYRDRDQDGSGNLDQPENSNTERVSVNRFGYPTNQLLNTADSASSRMPAVSGDGRFISFATDSVNTGGLRFDQTNRQPLDLNNFRDIFVFDRDTIVPIEDFEPNPPFITITNPTSGDTVSVTSPFFVSAGALGFDPSSNTFNQQSIASVKFFVNGVERAEITSPPFATQITPQGADNLRIFAVATDRRGNETSSSVVSLTTEVVPFDTPIVNLTRPVVGADAEFSRSDVVTLEATISSTAGSNLFLSNFTLERFDFFVNGISVFSSTEDLDTYRFDYEINLTGNVDISAGAVYRANVGQTVVNVSPDDLIRIQVFEFDPATRDQDFITDVFERILGRAPTDNESENGLQVLDGTLESRSAYLVELLDSSVVETTEVAMLIYRTMTGDWPDNDELAQALDDLLEGGSGITDANALTAALIPEFEIRFSALNTQRGFMIQTFKNKHGGVAPTPQAENRLFSSQNGPDVSFGGGLTVPGYNGDNVTYITQFALDNDINTNFSGPGGLPLSAVHLYGIPNDPKEDLKLALLIAALLEQNPTDQRIAQFDGMTLEAAVEEILVQYLGIESSTALPAALAGSDPLGSDWYRSDWFGSFASDSGATEPWVFSSDFGWVYVSPSGTPDGVWLFSNNLGTWMWGGSTLNGFFYNQDASQWMWVSSNNNGYGAWLYMTSDGEWEWVRP
jgi:hypothetical protein